MTGSGRRTCGPCRSVRSMAERGARPRGVRSRPPAVSASQASALSTIARRNRPRFAAPKAAQQSAVVLMLLLLLTVSPQPPSAFASPPASAGRRAMQTGVLTRIHLAQRHHGGRRGERAAREFAFPVAFRTEFRQQRLRRFRQARRRSCPASIRQLSWRVLVAGRMAQAPLQPKSLLSTSRLRLIHHR